MYEWKNMKNKNIRNWMLVFVYSSSYTIWRYFFHIWKSFQQCLRHPRTSVYLNLYTLFEQLKTAGIYREALTKSSDCMFWIPIQCCTTYKLNATQKNTCHIFPPKKIPRIENSKPKKSFNQPLNHLKSGVPATGTTVLL